MRICNSIQYLKILKNDLNEKTCEEIHDYKIIGEEGDILSQNFRHGTKHSIIRSGSGGKLVILKSSLKKHLESETLARNDYEMLSIDNSRKEIACIKIEAIRSTGTHNRPAIADFVIHNGFVYTLDMKYRCLKIFNGSFELSRTIPFPKSLDKAKLIHLAVFTKYILLATGSMIHYIINNDQCAEFKKLKFPNRILNIACYNNEEIIVRSINHCYSFKIEENSSEDIRCTHLPTLDRLSGLSLTNFTVKDNYFYAMCKKTDQVFRLNLTLKSTTDATIQ